ncbi:hypothetical protein Fmac_007838 [Flemingia macrophylla]|uniref:VQ domain-containing protein n=1 Tax=Flemingia macrophylla TaxID=520843 RepID=A0ABD1MVP0_9FABA
MSSSDEEYDSSHAAEASSFLNHFSSISNPQPTLVPPQPSMFDPSSTYLHPTPNLQHSSFLNLDSRGPRSYPNCTHPQTLPSATPTHDNVNAIQQLSSPPNNNNLVRNPKKRSRASRRAPTTVLTTDTTNFRSMVQEFTGIPPPPFSACFSRRLPFRANPFLSTPSRTLLHNNNTINVSLSPNNINNNSSINYQLLPDLSLPYQPPQNFTQNHPITIPTFHPSPPLHSLLPTGFGGFNQGHVNAHVVGANEHVGSEGMLLRSGGDGGGRRDPYNYGSCKLNISVSASSSLNHEKDHVNLEDIGNSSREGAVEAWICSSEQ